MPTINPALIPLKSIGNLFSSLTGGDTTLNIRWLEPVDPVFYETLNRPIADMAVRQLVIAKAIDALEAQIGHQTLFPFVVQPIVVAGSTTYEIPIGLIWDMQVSVPMKWRSLRLAQIQRVSGANSETEGYTGILRFVFSAATESDVSETYLFFADYQIESSLFFQPVEIGAVTSTIATPAINTGEQGTIGGYITFRTLDPTDSAAKTFLNAMAPSGGSSPAIYDLLNTPAGTANVTEDFSPTAETHGHGFLTESAWTAIPAVGSDFMSWLESSNYPFANDASLISDEDTIRTATEPSIPFSLFKELNMIVPAGDGPIGDATSGYYHVYINKITRFTSPDVFVRFYFATLLNGVYAQIAYLDLRSTNLANQALPIIPINTSGDDASDIGRGHVVLSDLWKPTETKIINFFNKMSLLPMQELTFSRERTRISSYGVSRISKYTPNKGQSDALAGSTSTLNTPISPSSSNRYVCEADQGLGNAIDFSTIPTIPTHSAIENVGYTGALTHRIVKLVMDSAAVPNDPTYYSVYVLPRLTYLLGRPPIFGDSWYNGVRFLTFNGDSWQG